MRFIIFLYIFSCRGNDIAINSSLPQHEVSAKNIDMGQRNQIRGQRERERMKLLPEEGITLKIIC